MSVATLSLDGFLFSGGDRRPPNALKINAEGAEMEILLGGRHTISKFSPLIFLSTHSGEIDRLCCEFLLSTGYSIQRMGVDKICAEKKL
jgi:hypothetical protein